MSLYQLQQVQQRYGDRLVLDLQELVIEGGAIYALVGANGAGKTTLLNLLGFLESPVSGRILFDGQVVRPLEADMHRCRRQVVVLDQHPIMFSGSVAANVGYGLRLRRIPRRERERIIDEVLDIVDLGRYRRANARRLSGGETQRLALARALAVSPRVFLCDEPTASVDTENRSVINALLRRINRERGITILFTTHERYQASSLADHTLVLERGRLVGSPYENVFSCEVTIKDSWVVCLLNTAQSLVLSSALAPRSSGRYRLYIDPQGIDLEAVNGTPQPGQLDGRITLMMQLQDQVRITIEAGVLVTVLVPQEWYRATRPILGDRVRLTLSPAALSWHRTE